MGRLTKTSGPKAIVDIDDLVPGIYGSSERWLTDEQVIEIADHICALPKIWNRLREVTSEDRIEGQLYIDLKDEIRAFLIKRDWRAAGDITALIHQFLRPRAIQYQTERSAGKF